ncbi:MAG TPA: hypothetical protein VGP07_07465 [Polyangia bacterium]|jgi:hypothetical protein
MATTPVETAPSKPDDNLPPRPSRLGHFIQTYSGFLSSFVIGVAGLVATSIWQYRQSQTAERQAYSEQQIAKTKAENDWRIARAEILAKNLTVLSSQGPDTADQRFGVLLSLTRGSILDPELAVSYALELGKVNPDYMRSVLASTSEKNYTQLEHAFVLTCLQRFGVERAAAICKDDKLSDRSDAIAQLIQDELDATNTVGAAPTTGAAAAPAGAATSAVWSQAGPIGLLHEEREVQAHPATLMWLFEPYLQDLYERRQWKEIDAFEGASVGARLIAALVLATARTGELVPSAEQAALVAFHTERRKWLVSYMYGRSCDSECRGKLIDVMVSTYGEAQGDYDEALRKLVLLSRAEAGPAMAQLHARLLWCQVDGDDLEEFRDRVLVPALVTALGTPALDHAILDDLVGLVALVPEPQAPAATETDADRVRRMTAGVAAWKSMTAALEKAGEKVNKAFIARRATIKRERANPPPMIKKVSFCTAAATDNHPAATLNQ